MDIYIVQSGDSIQSIAKKFDISVERLISDNGLINATSLVPGQSLVILYPQKTYIVKPGDTLPSIANANGITTMQLVRNNPFLNRRNYFYPGETLVISYGADRNIELNGFTFSFISRDILKRALPYLTYISIFNYRIVEDGQLINYGYDLDIIKIAKEYQTIPLLMVSAFSPSGEINLESIYKLLLSEEKLDKLVTDMIQIVRAKGFMGINALISNMNESNQGLYLKMLAKLSKLLRNEGFIFIVTFNPNLTKNDNIFVYENLDYNNLSSIVDRLIFLNTIWGINKQPPSPVSNISFISSFINYVTTKIPSNLIAIGTPLIGYDWELPFVPDSSYANSMSLYSTLTLAYDQQTTIYFDEISQTPYYNYVKSYVGEPQNHIVWFIDARSINSLNDIIINYNLIGSGIWNLSSSNQQLWSIMNARFIIVKLPV